MKFSSFTAVALLLGVMSANAADSPAPSAATGAAQAATAVVTPANDPAYVYKTLRLNKAAFDALASHPEQLLVLDVRRPDELTHIGGFPVYLSIQTGEIQKYLAYIPRDRIIVTVSNRAHRAGAVGDILAGYGFHVAGAIGVKDFEDEGGTLTKIPPAPPKNATAQATPPASPR